MATKVGGKALLKINGVQYPLRGNLTIQLGNVQRESVVGVDQVHGIKEMPVAPFIEMDITDLGDLDISAVQNATDVTINVELNNGKQAVLRNASQVNAMELNAVDGFYTARFEGISGQWIS